MRKIVGILDTMDHEIRALRKNGLREFARPLRGGENEQPVFSTLLGNSFINPAPIDGIAGWLLRDVPMRLFEKEMDWKPVPRLCLPEQAEGHPGKHRRYELDNLVLDRVHVDDHDLVAFDPPRSIACQTEELLKKVLQRRPGLASLQVVAQERILRPLLKRFEARQHLRAIVTDLTVAVSLLV